MRKGRIIGMDDRASQCKVRRGLLFLISYLLFLISSSLSSCALIEIDPDEEAKLPTKMAFPYDTVYVMQGDTFLVQPLFQPDSVANKTCFWLSLNPDIVNLENDTLVAEQEGWARIMATSVVTAMTDSVDVCVMKPWEIPNTAYPYEMVVYADVTVHGQPMTEDMILAAFIGDEIRGIGTPLRVGDKDLWRIRIYNDTQTALDYAEVSFTFCLYDRKTLQRLQFPAVVSYTGETYGTPSQPLELSL